MATAKKAATKAVRKKTARKTGKGARRKNAPPPPPKGNKRALGNKGGKGGPAKYDPDQHPDLAKGLSLLGVSEREMAAVLGVSDATIKDWKKTKPEFGAAIREGGEIADARVAKRLYDRALDGDVGAMKHWLGVRQRKRGWVSDTGIQINNTIATKETVAQRINISRITEARERARVLDGEVVGETRRLQPPEQELPDPPGV